MLHAVEVKWSYTWDQRTGKHEPVTDILTERGASRVAGHVSQGRAVAMLQAARKHYEKPKLEIVP